MPGWLYRRVITVGVHIVMSTVRIIMSVILSIMMIMSRMIAANNRRYSSTAVGFPKQIYQTTHPQSVSRDFPSQTRAHGRTQHSENPDEKETICFNSLRGISGRVQGLSRFRPYCVFLRLAAVPTVREPLLAYPR